MDLSLAHGVPSLEPIAVLLARLATGGLFALSGWHKLARSKRRHAMVDTLREGQIPSPRLAAPVVAATELVGGVLLVAGLFTPIVAAILAVQVLVALLAVQRRHVSAGADTSWWENFLYLPEVLYLVVFIWLATHGAGPLSLDRLAA